MSEKKKQHGAGQLLPLFVSFLKIGAFTFGGGYAMLPMLQWEVVENKGWGTEAEMMDYYAIGQCTPGIIAVNTATFVGQKTRGDIGGVVATLGVVFPSLVIITIIAGLVNNFADLAVVKNAFAGVRVCVCVLIFNAVVKLLKNAVTGPATAAIFILVMLGSLFLDWSPVIFVLIAAVLGILLQNIKERGKRA